MKQKMIAALALVAAASTAIANTYVVSSENGTSNDAPKLSVTHLAGASCVYGDKAVAVGDTIIIEGAETVLVCANASQGPVFYPLSATGGQRVIASLPVATSAAPGKDAAYKIVTPSAPGFTPVKAWNDGKSTFIALTGDYHGDLPMVFALAEDGSRSLVNFQWDQQNSRFVVERVLDRAILVLGDKSVVVSRT
jgi:hypothetical protein